MSSPRSSDQVRWETRALGAVIVPFLIAAFAILYFRPDDTGRLFAWPIAPRMTAFLLGSAYAGGAYFFVRVILEQRWHHVAVGFLPVTAFATLMMVATVLHWDKFTHGHVSFVTWTTLYATTPFLVLGVWLRNRATDHGEPDRNEVETPAVMRWAIGILGALVLATGLLLFAFPTLLIAAWPWPLTALTARVIGSCFALTGVFGLAIVRDRRWSAARIALQSQAIGVLLIMIGVARAWDEFKPARAFTWLFVGGMAALLVAMVGVYLVLERRRRPDTTELEPNRDRGTPGPSQLSQP
jgi:peptidoglycan/LPS O-acetylase OafA/YrhL